MDVIYSVENEVWGQRAMKNLVERQVKSKTSVSHPRTDVYEQLDS